MHLNNNSNSDYYEMTCLLEGPAIKSSPVLSLLARVMEIKLLINKECCPKELTQG